MSTFSFPRAAALAAGLLVIPAVSSAQQATPVRADSAPKPPATLQAVTVTATRRPTDVRDVPVAVSVVDSATIRERMPNSAADLLRELPGLDVVGTGPNQVRPAIRGQRGQRILLMQDGLRLNNSRRQQDFGELPALVDVADIERIEIVRGPSSVLYGSDAIGGVINLITQAPRPTGETTVRGIAGYQYGGAGNQRRLNGRVTATMGAFAFAASGATRDASNYRAPSGSFGDLSLANAVELQDSGVRDESLQLYAGWRGTAGHGVWLRQELYGARDAGFGFVEPRVLGDTSTKIALTYPWQSVRKTTAGFNSGALDLPFVDKVDVSGYTQRNARDFNSAVDVFIPTGPGRTATIQSRSFNYTDVRSHGFRAEASKVFAPVTVTYGADFVYDDTRNRDSSWSRTTGFGPFPVVSSNTRSTTPNAIMRNLGLFAQGDWRVIDRLSVITGVRYHDVHAETKRVVASSASAPQEANNRTSVYAVNALYRVTDNVRVVASHGRGFRAPNLIERYFSGPSTDGTAIQIANPTLRPEQSRNVDIGVRFTNARVSAELFAFQSNITDGIVVRPTGRTFGRQAEFQNINVEKLETTGYEVSLGVEVGRGVSVTGNYTKIDTKNPATPDVPVAGTYNSRLNVSLGYRPASGRFWTEYAVRHHGRQQDINLGTSPVGAVVPSFTVMHLRGGVRVASFGGRTQELTVALNNLGNVLYAEAANTAFFRPEPARHLVVGVRAAF